ncbi:MAG: VTT domain-containing protein [Candidatus Sungbacteria bacterium]|nr:VTT domain-containing protein [bacterium]MDZ4260384.1 VTT domain-containing protein [Candidatus Sungbacteria bacterium]
MEALFGMNISALVQASGLLGVFAIVFAESGLFIGFFLPGDSLLFTAGFLSSQGLFSITLLMIGSFIAAVAGDNVGYAFGKRAGKKIFTREKSLIFRKDHLESAKRFYEMYGSKTIILARFIPVVRTFAPLVAGVAQMNYRTFFLYNIVGGGLWTLGLTGLGYFLGSVIPGVDRYLIPLIGLIIFLSLLPPLVHILKDKKDRAAIWRWIRQRGSL